MAHRGVLFLDELPEFPRAVLESLREPLEDRRITIARAKGAQVYPASFQLIASQNPCRCGNFGSRKKICVCSPGELLAYRRRVSGAILDRVDIRFTVSEHEGGLTFESSGESTDAVRNRVTAARNFARSRGQSVMNSELTFRELKKFCRLSDESIKILELSKEKFGLSLRAVHKVIKTARSIADLALTGDILTEHLAEALQYRTSEEREPSYA